MQVLSAAPLLCDHYCQHSDAELGPLGGAMQQLLQAMYGKLLWHPASKQESCAECLHHEMEVCACCAWQLLLPLNLKHTKTRCCICSDRSSRHWPGGHKAHSHAGLPCWQQQLEIIGDLLQDAAQGLYRMPCACDDSARAIRRESD